MRTSHFDRALLPPAKVFYENELGRLGRPSHNGWAKANCVFHQSRSRTSLNVNVNTGAFRCFSCEAHGGDVIDFLRLRDKLDFKQAAQVLGTWRGQVTPEESRKLRAREQARQRQRNELAAQAERERGERLNARDELHAAATLYGEAIAEHDWEAMSELLPRVRQLEQHYCVLAGLENPYE